MNAEPPNKLSVFLEGRKRADFARELGISSAYLTQLANRDRTPGLGLALKIERVTNGAVPVSSWYEEAA
jgi:DNA-binding transcriptional regulator YdaS (Cro superfamily)